MTKSDELLQLLQSVPAARFTVTYRKFPPKCWSFSVLVFSWPNLGSIFSFRFHTSLLCLAENKSEGNIQEELHTLDVIDHVNHISIWKHSEEWKYREVQRGKYKAEKHNEAAGKERRRGTDQAWYRARVVQQTTEDSTSAWKTATLHARTNFGILSCFLSGPIFLSLIIWFYNPVLGHCLFSEKQLTIYFSWLPLRVSYLKLILSSY